MARQNNFSIFDRQYRNLDNEIVFFRALDDHGKSVFDYALEHKNRQAIKRLLELIDENEQCKVVQRKDFCTLKHICLNNLVVKNIDKIDFENPDDIAKLKKVFHVFTTAPYRVENIGIEN